MKDINCESTLVMKLKWNKTILFCMVNELTEGKSEDLEFQRLPDSNSTTAILLVLIVTCIQDHSFKIIRGNNKVFYFLFPVSALLKERKFWRISKRSLI